MVTDAVTYGQLQRLLIQLKFENVPTRPTWNAYRHAPSGTVIMLAARRPDQPARRPDLASVRRHLADNGILTEAEFDRRIGARG
jgi:hypothetical protein